MPWWSSVPGKKVERHGTLVQATDRIEFAVQDLGVELEGCGLYARDPADHPDEPNRLAEQLSNAKVREATMVKMRKTMGRTRGRAA